MKEVRIYWSILGWVFTHREDALEKSYRKFTEVHDVKGQYAMRRKMDSFDG